MPYPAAPELLLLGIVLAALVATQVVNVWVWLIEWIFP